MCLCSRATHRRSGVECGGAQSPISPPGFARCRSVTGSMRPLSVREGHTRFVPGGLVHSLPVGLKVWRVTYTLVVPANLSRTLDVGCFGSHAFGYCHPGRETASSTRLFGEMVSPRLRRYLGRRPRKSVNGFEEGRPTYSMPPFSFPASVLLRVIPAGPAWPISGGPAPK